MAEEQNFFGNIGSALGGLLGFGQQQPSAGGPTDPYDMLSEAEKRRLTYSTLGQLGATLLAAGQKQMPAQRAQILSQLGSIAPNIETSVFRSQQARLMNAQMQEKMLERQRLEQLEKMGQNPDFLKAINMSPEQWSVLGPAGRQATVQAIATRDPLQQAAAQMAVDKARAEDAARQQALAAIDASEDMTEPQKKAARLAPLDWAKTLIKPSNQFVEEVRTIDGKPTLGQKETTTGKWTPYSTGSGTTINMGDRALEQGIAKSLIDSADVAQSAAGAINSIGRAREQFDQGIISGITAPVELTIRKIGTAFGFDSKQVANTEAFRSSLGPIVLDVVKGLGAGTSISNADRDYALSFVGGDVKLDNQSIARILDIVERASAEKIDTHNEKVQRYIAKAKDPTNAEFLVVTNPRKKREEEAAAAAAASGGGNVVDFGSLR